MRIGTAKGLAIIAIASPLLVVIALLAILSVGRVNGGARGPEASAVRSITQSLLIYANAHEGKLPSRLSQIDEEEIILPEKLTLDMFIYIAPRDTTTEMSMDTPLILFPWESGAHIGYLGGNVSYMPGGYGNTFSTSFDRRLRKWRIAFGIAVLLNVGFIWAYFSRRRRRSGKPNQSGEGTA